MYIFIGSRKWPFSAASTNKWMSKWECFLVILCVNPSEKRLLILSRHAKKVHQRNLGLTYTQSASYVTHRRTCAPSFKAFLGSQPLAIYMKRFRGADSQSWICCGMPPFPSGWPPRDKNNCWNNKEANRSHRFLKSQTSFLFTNQSRDVGQLSGMGSSSAPSWAVGGGKCVLSCKAWRVRVFAQVHRVGGGADNAEEKKSCGLYCILHLKEIKKNFL